MLEFFKRKRKNSDHFNNLAAQLEQRKTKALEKFKSRHTEATRWARKRGIRVEDIAVKGAKGVATTIAAGAVALSSGAVPGTQTVDTKTPNQREHKRDITDIKIETKIKAREDVTSQVKNELSTVNLDDEKLVEKKLTSILKIPVKAQLEGIRLNTTYGIMGYESHLSRFPGDNLATHFQTDIEYQKFSKANMAGGPGAWGYLAASQKELTTQDIEREKYYLVAQTFLSPNWGPPAVKAWFRHRKMVVVNPQNGVVAIGVLEDAGPEARTSRQFGGSPEIFAELNLFATGPRVLMYFVDDPKNQIPLGRYGI